VSICEFFETLKNHDWFTSWSDAPLVYWEGEVRSELLHELALANGPAFAWLNSEFVKFKFSGKPWGTEKLPEPMAPIEPSLGAMIDLRGDYERLAFAPAGAGCSARLLERARCMGALAFDQPDIPRLISSVEPLHEAWRRGQQEANETYQSLRPAGRMAKLLAAQEAAKNRAQAQLEEEAEPDWGSV
jgi:hypothetical protein